MHPGTQVLVGRYDGSRQLLTHERDLFSRVIDGKKHYLSQSSFVIGKAFIQVFADPWRNSAPELEPDEEEPLIALLPSHRRKLEWPPAISIDDAGYNLVRSGGVEEDDDDDDADADSNQSGVRLGAQGDPAAYARVDQRGAHARCRRRAHARARLRGPLNTLEPIRNSQRARRTRRPPKSIASRCNPETAAAFFFFLLFVAARGLLPFRRRGLGPAPGAGRDQFRLARVGAEVGRRLQLLGERDVRASRVARPRHRDAS